MRRSAAALRMVFSDPFNLTLGVVTLVATLVFLAWAAQVVTRFPYGGLYWDLQPSRVVAIGALSAGFGLVVPVHAEALRALRVRARARSAAGLAVGWAGGIAAVSCCSPLLFPAVAGLLGASGSTVLSFNLALHRWFVPLTLLALGVLLGSGALALRDLAGVCWVADDAGHDRGSADPPATTRGPATDLLPAPDPIAVTPGGDQHGDDLGDRR